MASKKSKGTTAGGRGFSKFRSRWWAFCEIDRQIRRGRPCTNRSLASDLEVDERTVRRYIAFMREELAAPIEWNPIDERFELTDVTWTMPNVHLSDQELLTLAVATRSMAAVMSPPFAEALEKLLAKLLDALPTDAREELNQLKEQVDFVPAAVTSKGQEWVKPLIEALRERQTVEMSYWVFSRDVLTQRRVDPYHLRHFAGAWYLVGFDHNTKQCPVFNLARIRSLKLSGDSFNPKAFDATDYFRGSFGITAGGEPKTVRIRLTGRMARTAEEKIWPKGFAYKPDGEESGVLEGAVGKLDELLTWIASCDGDAEMLPDRD